MVDVHLDSSFKKATLQSSSEIRIRTPPDQNEHEFLIKDCDHIEIVGFQNFTNHAVENAENYRKVSLSGENTAGHPRKVAFVDFGGAIELAAPKIKIEAESWAQKQFSQSKRFPNKATEAFQKYRFY